MLITSLLFFQLATTPYYKALMNPYGVPKTETKRAMVSFPWKLQAGLIVRF